MILSTQFKEAKKYIENSHNILLTMHERMDGDDGAATMALALHTERGGKEITHYVKGGVPKQLQFLPRAHKVTQEVNLSNIDLIVMSGCSTKDRCGNKEIIESTIPVLNFDHHPDNTHFGTVNIVDPGKSAVAELMYDFFMFAEWPITPDIATCLLTGIFTDTGSFMHSNTKASTLIAAAHLLKKGAHTDKIARHTFRSKTPKQLTAWGKALENIYFDRAKKMIYAVVTEPDLASLGQLPQATFDGLVETLNKVPEAKFALFIRQEGNTIKGSFRSDPIKGVDVSQIAKQFGGGGHKYASGFSLLGQLVKNDLGNWKVVSN